MHPSVVSGQRSLRGPAAWLAALLVFAATVVGVGLVGSGTAGALTAAEVSLIQRDLNGLGYDAGPVDGDYGPRTTAAVRRLQQDSAIAVDGVAGSVTTAALKGKVRQVQQAAGSSPDGDYGPNTTAAVRSWQSAHGLAADGIAGAATMVAMRLVRTVVTGGTSAQKIERVIAAAQTQTGKGITYAWNGGTQFGPTYGVCCSPAGFDDRSRFGYDCSGLMQYVFWQGSGVDVGDWTGAQYSRGTRVPNAQRQRGDMIFYGSGSTTTHVALYLGNGRMLEADSPRTSTSVHETAVRTSGMMPSVIRTFP
jgi:peptidoglycan hydrolase-like protein with peptidoglycan-binding domain